MKYNPEIHHRRSIRLKEYDYSQSGAYFITIATYERQALFGDIVEGKLEINEFGLIIKTEWVKTSELRPNIELDEFIIMPNHLHGIVVITDNSTLQRAPTFERFGKPTSNSIPTVIRLFKSATTKQINEKRNMSGSPVWQRNYYEHIIRNENELNEIREYILQNPLKWDKDDQNPINTNSIG